MKRKHLKDKQLLTILVLVCTGLIFLTASIQPLSPMLRRIGGTLVVPMQSGVAKIGEKLVSLTDGFRSSAKLAEENRQLREENESLTAELSRYAQIEEELGRLEQLYKLDQEYPDYPKVAAKVIAKDPGNWYDRITVDKGSEDGIAVDMNVLAGGGLFGIVTEVGPNWARIRSIIDDENNISAMTASTSDICTVTGSLLDYQNGTIRFYGLRDAEEKITEGEAIITSSISGKYLPGFTIGYVATIAKDANNLTRSGKLRPASSFDVVREVLIVTTVREEIREDAE